MTYCSRSWRCDETRIERNLESRSINELFRISDAIKDGAPSQDKAAEVLDYFKRRLDELNIPWEMTPEENTLVIQFKFVHCRVWNHSTCSWTTITSDGFEYQHGTMYFITIDREGDIQFVKQKKSEPLNKELQYVPFPVTTVQISDNVETAIPGKRQICGATNHR